MIYEFHYWFCRDVLRMSDKRTRISAARRTAAEEAKWKRHRSVGDSGQWESRAVEEELKTVPESIVIVPSEKKEDNFLQKALKRVRQKGFQSGGKQG